MYCVSGCGFLRPLPFLLFVHYSTQIYWNIGTQATCSIQGFFTQFSFVAVAYNLNLALYYVLVVVYSWKHAQLRRVEPYCHGWALLFSIGSASTMAYLGMYNQAIWDCWIAPQPLGCQESWDYVPTTSSSSSTTGAAVAARALRVFTRCCDL